MAQDERPWWERIPAIVFYPASAAGVTAAIFLGGLAWLAELVIAYGALGFGAAVIVGLIFTTYFAIIRESADGRTTFPEIGNYRNVREDVVFPGLKAGALAVFLFLPVIWLVAVGEIDTYQASHVKAGAKEPQSGAEQISEMLKAQGIALPGAPQEPRLDDDRVAQKRHPIAVATPAPEPEVAQQPPRHSGRTAAIVFATILASVLYPLCLLILAMSRSVLAAMNPLVWGQILAAVGVPAWLGVLGGIFGLGLAGAVLAYPFDLLAVAIPVLPSIAASVVYMWFSLAAAHLLGWFVWQHRAELGYTADVREEMDADRVRRIKEATIAEISRSRGRAPIPAGGGVMVGAAAGGVPAPAARAPTMPPSSRTVPDAPADALPPTADEIGALTTRLGAAAANNDRPAMLAITPSLLDVLWQTGNLEAVRRVWMIFSKVDPEASLDPQRQARIARFLEERKLVPEAASAWRVLALKHPDSPQASKALFRSSDCYTRAGQPEAAKSALEILVARYPGTDEAQQARSKLRSLSRS